MDDEARLKRLARFEKLQSASHNESNSGKDLGSQSNSTLDAANPTTKIANEAAITTLKDGPQPSSPGSIHEQPPKEKKRRRTVSPKIILGSALSYIIGNDVVFHGKCHDENTPTGIGNPSRAILMQLPFDVNSEENWQVLVDHFVNDLLPKHADRFVRTVGPTLQDVSKCHSRLQEVQRSGWKHYPKHSQLDRCLNVLNEQVILLPIVEALQDDIKKHRMGKIEDAEDDLFEYTNSSERQYEIPEGPVERLLFHIESPVPRVSNAFIKDLSESFRGEVNLSAYLVKEILERLPHSTSTEVMTGRLNAIANLLVSSSSATEAVAARLSTELALFENLSGRELENQLWLAPVLSACAYCVPPAGSESGGGNVSLFLTQLEKIPQFPTCVYDSSSCTNYNTARDNARKTMGIFRDATKSLFETLFRKAGKAIMFQWLQKIAQANEPMAFLPKPDLLALDGAAGTCCSRSLLLGMSSFLVYFCTGNLNSQFAKKGANVFDFAYMMISDKTGFFQSTTNPLFMGRRAKFPKVDPEKQFSGATEFFFLTSALLRVSLYPLIRMEDEFLHRYTKLLQSVEAASRRKETLAPQVVSQSSPVVSTWLAYKVFLEDPGFIQNMTNFTLLQLEWLLSIVSSENDAAISSIPDWLCKEPCQWLRFSLLHSWYQLKPGQVERAIDIATQLLQLGMKSSDFSPLVVTALIRIPSASVQAGVARARELERQRRRGHFGRSKDQAETDIDDDKLDIYSSFDKMDLGVSVFSNARVQDELCPALMNAFQSLDTVEGLDVDREHAFDKFSVKLEVTKLFLRLFNHPDGKCRQSILGSNESQIAQFASSISAAIGYLFDDACLRMADACKYSLRFKSDSQSGVDVSYEQKQTTAAANNFLSTRELLKLLLRLSHEPRLAKILGGVSQSKNGDKVASDLAVMVIHFLDLMTGPDGGTHPDLEYQRDGSDPTSALFACESIMSEGDKAVLARAVAKSRYMALSKIGFDASMLCHLLLALAAKWHHSAAEIIPRESPLLLALAAHEDCDVLRYRRILERLVQKPSHISGSEAQYAKEIFKHDGYVDWDLWSSSYEDVDEWPDEEKNTRRLARKCHISRAEINSLSSNERISSFLDDLEARIERAQRAAAVTTVPKDRLPEVEQNVLAAGAVPLEEQEYGKFLSEYVVSSSPFAGQAGSFAHHYDAIARRNGASGSGKSLQKEARRCHKTLPTPHANSASFICFAEERMDLSKALITGPTDTPYALGLFVFDVFYPSQYPRIPPLINFMTTGGGQTRFGPNLYQDGKVCLSLLGTFNALDESERWNPDRSSLSQVLLSIQTQLLVEEPYFNEPGAERMEGTEAGRDASRRYNANLRLATLRYAIIQPLKHLPLGFEEISIRHFSMCRKRILVQAKRWMLESKNSSLFPRFEKAYTELLHLLSTKERINYFDALPPLMKDIEAVSKLDPTFRCDQCDDRKPSAVETSTVAEVPFNPWAQPNMHAQMNTGQTHQDYVGVEDEEFYT